MKEENNKSLDQQLTVLTGGKWNNDEEMRISLCYKDKPFTFNLGSNPTYSHADEILNLMKGLGEEKYRKFIHNNIGVVFKVSWVNEVGDIYDYYINDTYILNPEALKQKAVEFLKQTNLDHP